MEPRNFILSIAEQFNDQFKAPLNFDHQCLMECVQCFYDFIGRMLNLFRNYRPLENDLIHDLDSIELKDEHISLKEKRKERSS